MNREMAMNRFLVLIIAIGILMYTSGCTTSALPVAGNLQTAVLNNTTPKTSIMVIADQRKGPMWFAVHNGETSSLKNVPRLSIGNIDSIWISPDDKFMAVTSVGEGHAYLDIFDLVSILASRDSENDLCINPLLSLAPYPGYVSVKKWEDDNLVLQSDMDLHLLNKKTRRPPYYLAPDTAKPKQFHWNIATDTIVQQ